MRQDETVDQDVGAAADMDRRSYGGHGVPTVGVCDDSIQDPANIEAEDRDVRSAVGEQAEARPVSCNWPRR